MTVTQNALKPYFDGCYHQIWSDHYNSDWYRVNVLNRCWKKQTWYMFPVRFHCICVTLRLSATLVHNVEDSYISKNNTHSPYATEEKAMGY